ncbi:hypothetical protein [Roseovarius sp. MMSF_3281]|uniref:hypothetical protein n=1 Tax=Roseovarius sp. MMSF_3281 TaxID=3046694 RepID=UPI00273D0255|nr:hypothetical protein [Roseovarius sp. MMSF_3281]
MAKTVLSIQVKSNVDALARAVGAMQAHFEAAPDDDPAKCAMIAFGEIDAKRHIQTDARFEDGVCHVTLSMCPELQAIADMVAG